VSNQEPAGTRRERNRWGEGDRLRREILDASFHLVSVLGAPDALTIRGVARAVGIAPASIYQHFSDKPALVRGTIEHGYARLAQAMLAADETGEPNDVVGRVRAQMHAYCRFAIDNPGHYRLMLSVPPSSFPGDAPDPDNPVLDIVDQVIASFERCQRAGIRLRMTSHRAGVMVFVAAHGRVALYHADRGKDRDPEKIIPFVDDMIMVLIESGVPDRAVIPPHPRA
jgi:AcrR family transcriptional regulator